MMTDRQKNIQRLATFPSYLEELAVLIGRAVSAEELWSEQETSHLRGTIKELSKGRVVRAIIPFEGRVSDSFTAMIEQLQLLNGSPLVLWPPKANACGVLVVPSLKHINFAFPFDLNPEGILVVATKDGCDRMLLDFSDEDDVRSLEIELCGKHWSQATPPTSDSLV